MLDMKFLRARLSAALTDLTLESLIELFLEISKLPETPSTVTYILESMGLEDSIPLVETWVETEDPETLGDVFDYFSDDFLSNIYIGVTNQVRVIIYEYLSPNTIDRLPTLGEFQVTQLTVSPGELESGDLVTLSFMITNIGSGTDDYTIPLKINDIIIETFTGTLGIGDSNLLTYSQEVENLGEYTITVLDELTTFNVVQLSTPLIPAQLIITSMEVLPLEVQQGENLLIITEIRNEGDLPGSERIELMIDDILVDTKIVEVQGGKREVIYFDSVATHNPGTHVISIQEKTVEFSVLSPPENRPWLTIIITAIVIIGGLAYLLHERGIIKLPVSIISNRRI